MTTAWTYDTLNRLVDGDDDGRGLVADVDYAYGVTASMSSTAHRGSAQVGVDRAVGHGNHSPNEHQVHQ